MQCFLKGEGACRQCTLRELIIKQPGLLAARLLRGAGPGSHWQTRGQCRDCGIQRQPNNDFRQSGASRHPSFLSLACMHITVCLRETPVTVYFHRCVLMTDPVGQPWHLIKVLLWADMATHCRCCAAAWTLLASTQSMRWKCTASAKTSTKRTSSSCVNSATLSTSRCTHGGLLSRPTGRSLGQLWRCAPWYPECVKVFIWSGISR